MFSPYYLLPCFFPLTHYFLPVTFFLLSFSVCVFKHNLSIYYPSIIYLSMYLSSICHLFTIYAIYLSIYLPIYASIIYLPSMSIYLPIYLSCIFLSSLSPPNFYSSLFMRYQLTQEHSFICIMIIKVALQIDK